MKMLGLTALVKEVEKEKNKVTSGGIYVPETVQADDSFIEAEVVEVGPGEHNSNGHFIKPEFKKGDTIVLDRGFAKPIKRDNKEFLVVSARDVIAIL